MTDSTRTMTPRLAAALAAQGFTPLTVAELRARFPLGERVAETIAHLDGDQERMSADDLTGWLSILADRMGKASRTEHVELANTRRITVGHGSRHSATVELKGIRAWARGETVVLYHQDAPQQPVRMWSAGEPLAQDLSALEQPAHVELTAAGFVLAAPSEVTPLFHELLPLGEVFAYTRGVMHPYLDRTPEPVPVEALLAYAADILAYDRTHTVRSGSWGEIYASRELDTDQREPLLLSEAWRKLWRPRVYLNPDTKVVVAYWWGVTGSNVHAILSIGALQEAPEPVEEAPAVQAPEPRRPKTRKARKVPDLVADRLALRAMVADRVRATRRRNLALYADLFARFPELTGEDRARLIRDLNRGTRIHHGLAHVTPKPTRDRLRQELHETRRDCAELRVHGYGAMRVASPEGEGWSLYDSVQHRRTLLRTLNALRVEVGA